MLKLFQRLPISHRLMLISVLFLIPDSVLVTLFLFSINANIRFARWEQHGNAYQRPLERLLEYLPDHLRLTGAATTEPRRTGDVTTVRAQIDQALTDLEATNARLGALLQFTDDGLAKRGRQHFRVETLTAEWVDLKTNLARLPEADRIRRHLHLLADVRTMITHAGDTSNLILDPDLDSYYLMDVTLLALPQMQDRLAAVMAYEDTLLGEPTLSSQARSRLAVDAALLQEADLDRVVSSTRTALNEDANFYGRSETLQRNLPGALDAFAGAGTAFINATARLSDADQAADRLEECHVLGDRARTASFALWTVANRELDGLLQLRIDAYVNRRTKSLGLVALAVLAAVGFVTVITRTISGPLQKQAAALQASNRTLHAEIQERQRAEAALIDASRAAGMAEVATGVLHNVGNVLNSVNLGTTGIRERLDASRLGHLRKVTTLFEQHRDDLPAFLTTHPQGQTIPGFLSKLTTHLEDDHGQMRGQIDALQEHVDHIKHLVSMQQSYARVLGVMETVEPASLIEEAVRLNADSLGRHHVVIDRQFASQRTVTIDRHKVLQILVNLLRNAKQAIEEANPADRRVTIRVHDKGSDQIVISVSDTGTGISRDHLAKIFRHGFTTKKDGHGFGLHSSALAAGEMHGTLSVHSEGPARGATFTLALPSTSPA